MPEESLTQALEHMLRAIVQTPDKVRVVSRNTSRGQLLEVHVAEEDLGRVIGRGGRTARALRTVMRSLAHGHGIRIDVIDPGKE